MTPFKNARASEPAVILGDDPVNVLGLARNLGREGVTVARVGAIRSGLLRSRYIRKTWIVPGIDDDPDDRFVAILLAAARELGGRPVLFPASDLQVLRVARNSRALADSFRLLVSNAEAAETLVNKRRFYESLARLGIPHPSTRFPAGAGGFAAAAAEIGFPVLLKPEISPLFARRFRKKGFVAHDPRELREHLEVVESYGLPVMVQEIIPGDARCMHGCAGLRTGSATLLFCYRRVREYPPGFGCGSLLESVSPFVGQTRLFEYLDHIGYTGLFDAEFKLDPRDGAYKLIEINARSWWQNMHPTVSGVNVIAGAYDHATGRPVVPGDYRVGTKWIHLYNDFFAARASGLGLLAWRRSLRGERAFDIFAADDPRPMLAFLGETALRKLSKIRGGS